MEQRLLIPRTRALVVLLLAGLLGCASSNNAEVPISGQAPQSTPGDAATSPPGGQSPATSMPPKAGSIDLLVVDSRDRAILLAAQNRLLGDCMRAQGFQFYEPSLEVFQSSIASSEQARRANFPFNTSVEGPRYAPIRSELLDSRNDEYLATLSDGEVEAYNRAAAGSWDDTASFEVVGVSMQTPRGGCVSEARRALYGSVEQGLSAEFVTANFDGLILNTVRADRTVIDAENAWSDCMSASGYDFAQFEAARAAANQTPEVAEGVAAADGLCVVTSGLGVTFATAYSSERQMVLEQNTEAVRSLDGALEKALTRAEEILAVA